MIGRPLLPTSVACFSLLVLASPSAAQYRDEPSAPTVYRDGQPEVLARPLPAPDGSVLTANAFRSHYQKAGSPRLMVMWNKSFSDEVGSAYKDHLHVEDDRSGGSTTTQGVARTWYGAYGREDTSQHAHETLDATDGAERVSSDRASPLDEGTDWEIESAFADELSSNGVRLVDRNMAMRTTAMNRDLGDHPNVQAVEAKAAARDADLVVEILQTSAWSSPAGVLFRISVKDVRNARTVAILTSTGRPPAHHMPFVAGPGGYVRAIMPAPSPHEIGRQLAQDLMASMSSRI